MYFLCIYYWVIGIDEYHYDLRFEEDKILFKT